MEKITKYLDYVIYWCIVLIPFSISIASAPMNVFMGFLIFSFLTKKILKRERLFIRTPINEPLFFLFLVTCLSVFNSVSFKDTLRGGIFRLLQYIFIFFIILEELKDKKQVKTIVFSMIAGLIMASIDGIWQVGRGHSFIRKDYAPVINLGLVRATASFKDSNTLGIYLSALAPLLFGLTIYYVKGIKKIVFVAISLLVLLGIALTYSRPTLLAIYVALFFLGWAKKNRILIISLAILLLISPFLLPQSVKEWAREVGYNPLRFMCNDDRIAIYRNSLNMIRAHPIIGLGANTYMKNYKKYKESPEYRNVGTADYLYAHNNFLHMAAEIGVAGLAIFIWLLYNLFKGLRRIYFTIEDDYLKIVSISLAACLIAFLANGLTESSLYYSRVAIIFWYIAGFSFSLKKFVRA